MKCVGVRIHMNRETYATQAYLDNFNIIVCYIALQLIPTLANACHFDLTVQLCHSWRGLLIWGSSSEFTLPYTLVPPLVSSVRVCACARANTFLFSGKTTMNRLLDPGYPDTVEVEG